MVNRLFTVPFPAGKGHFPSKLACATLKTLKHTPRSWQGWTNCTFGKKYDYTQYIPPSCLRWLVD